MPTTKNPMIRYQAIDQCLHNRRLGVSINVLVDRCCEALQSAGAAHSVSKRQVYLDLQFMKSLEGFNAPIESVREGNGTYYKYSDPTFTISQMGILAKEAESIMTALLPLKRFQGTFAQGWVDELYTRMASIKLQKNTEVPVVLFDENKEYTGAQWLHAIYENLSKKIKLKIVYKPFNFPQAEQFVFLPYLLKEYNKRWFLIGKREDDQEGNFVNLALDRIEQLEGLKATFEREAINWEEDFDNVIGVSIPRGEKPQKVVLKVEKSSVPYILSKPLHASQRKPEFTEDGGAKITIHVVVNFELKQHILALGANCSVLEPEHLRQSLKKEIAEMALRYSEHL